MMASTDTDARERQGITAHRVKILKAFIDQGSPNVWAYANDITKATGLWAAEVDHILDALVRSGRITRRNRPPEADSQYPTARSWVFYMTSQQYQQAHGEVGGGI